MNIRALYLKNRDFVIYSIISVIIFLVSFTLGYMSDSFIHLSGKVLIIVSSIVSFSLRYVLLKVMKFSKKVKE